MGNGTRIDPQVVIAQEVTVGENCHFYPFVSIREGSQIGARVVLHSGVVVGSDGYGYELMEGRHQKMLQAGIVEIGDDVEIGANTCIDRARFGATVIGEGTKVDNLVQIGHNVKIGKHCLVVAQTGISGSSEIGDYVTLAAQSGVGGHVKVASKTTCAGRTGVIADTDEGEFYFGYPAKPLKEWARGQMHLKRLPTLLKRIAGLEKRIEKLED